MNVQISDDGHGRLMFMFPIKVCGSNFDMVLTPFDVCKRWR